MPEIILSHLTKKFSDSIAVDDLNLKIDDGDFVSLLGPSGCGKTTTLRMIAGLETPSSGEIFIDGKCVYSKEKGIDASADKRGIGFLFQNYALWPHMTVRQNISFGLENKKWDKIRIERKVEEMLRTMRIEEFRDRYPSELSGGQQQRVAIARTLATEPSILLMDEPLSNLDAKLRVDMRTELKKLHKSTGATFVYVTHDQLEAMALSTKVCLMKQAVLQQYCKPLDLYRFPCNTFVANFIGSPAINLLEMQGHTGSLSNGVISCSFHPSNVFCEDAVKRCDSFILGIRPELVSIYDENDGDNSKECHCVSGVVVSSLPSGMETQLCIDVNGSVLNCMVFGDIDFEVDRRTSIGFDSNKYVLFDGSNGRLVASGGIELK